jgi:F-type H+-transporting ATPase subunit gamma
MKRALVIQEEVNQVSVISDLASVFEGIASIRIARIKDKVVASKEFFAELWQIYTQLRKDTEPQMLPGKGKYKDKNIFVVITSEGGLSGDIDSKIIDRVKQEYDPAITEVLVLGSHGAILLSQAGIPIIGGYRLPDSDAAIDTSGIIAQVSEYHSAAVFYQTYESLGVQAVSKIDLVSAVRAQGQGTHSGEEVISSRDYIFEPSLEEIITYMESVVVGLTVGQAILESRLAQYASRFNAMSLAKRRAHDLGGDLLLSYRRAKRAESDDRLKETMIALKGLS